MNTPTSPCGLAKHCSKCHELKPRTEFHKCSRASDGRRSDCKDCFNAARSARYHDDPTYQQNYHLQRTYGVTLEGYDELLEKQGGGCAICSKTPGENGQRLAVDHNHRTDQIRGLLCTQCNTGLGNLRDSVEVIRSAIRYLTEKGSYCA